MAKKSKENKEKVQAIKAAMKKIENEYGEGSIMKLGGSAKKSIPSISTGSLSLDFALGIGGIPKSRVTEIYGPEASGKTTLATHIFAEAQKAGGTAALVDAEHAFDPSWAKLIGVDLDELLISQPDTGEQALEITETLIRSGAVDVIVVDSVAALVPKAEIEGEMGDAMMGVQARLMSQALRKLTGAISKSNTAVIFTNQLRMKIGVMFGNPETTPGGRALKFYSSVRLDMRRIGRINQGDDIIGSRHRVKVVKNKVAPPFKKAEFDIMNSGGISREGDIIDMGVDLEIIKKAGSYFKFEGDVIAQGREASKQELKENKTLANKLKKLIRKKIQAK